MNQYIEENIKHEVKMATSLKDTHWEIDFEWVANPLAKFVIDRFKNVHIIPKTLPDESEKKDNFLKKIDDNT